MVTGGPGVGGGGVERYGCARCGCCGHVAVDRTLGGRGVTGDGGGVVAGSTWRGNC